MNRIYFTLLLGGLMLCTSCATQRVATTPDAAIVDHLTPAERREFDYLYLEGSRQSMLQHHDIAFELYSRAAAIDTLHTAVKYNLANYYLQLNQPQPALTLLESATTIEPDNYWYGSLLGNLLYRLNRGEEAIPIYQHLISLYPKKIELNYMLAEVYNHKGDLPSAIAALDHVEEVMGKNEQVTMEKVRMYKSLGQQDSIFAEVEELIKAYPSQVSNYTLLGSLYLEESRLDEALACYNRALAIEPDNSTLLVALSAYYERIGDQEALYDLIQRIVVNPEVDEPTKEELLVSYISSVLQQKGELEQIYPLFDLLLREHPDMPSYRKLYADLFITQKRYDEATQQLQQAVALDPKNREYWKQLFNLAMYQSQYAEMIELGGRAMQEIPEELSTYLYMGSAYAAQEQYAAAIEVLQQGLKQGESSNFEELASIYAQLGDTYHEWGRMDKTYEMYDKALEYDPDNAMVMNNYSYFLTLEKRELDKAERMSGKVVKIEPKNATYLDTYAWVFFTKGNYMLAKIYLDSALANGGDKSADILEHYGDVLYMDGDIEGAVTYWQRALELGSSSELLQKKIDQKRYLEP